MDELIASITVPDGILVNATVEEALAAGASQKDIDAALSSEAWKALKTERTRRLDGCDWAMISDAPLSAAQKTAWKDYRQALRDLPAKVSAAKMDPADALNNPAMWPIAPTL
jgi:hypothetical protein